MTDIGSSIQPHVFLTPNHHGYNVKFSSYQPNLLACATSTNYGISGPGSLFIFDTRHQSNPLLQLGWKDSLCDVVWSESNQNILATASGDGTLQVWNLSTAKVPIVLLEKHRKEVYTLDWSQGKHEHLLASGSWDGTAIVWDMTNALPITELNNNSLVYNVSWSPHIPYCLATVSGDGNLRIWDTKNPAIPSQIIKAHDDEALSCSWNYFKEGIIVTSSVDGLIRGWDLRLPRQPVFQLVGHNYAVKRVKCSPHKQSLLASVSYDYTSRIWDWDLPNPIHTFEHHKEFVYGLDFNDQVEGVVADCGWDQQINVFFLPVLKPSI